MNTLLEYIPSFSGFLLLLGLVFLAVVLIAIDPMTSIIILGIVILAVRTKLVHEIVVE